MNSHCPVAQTNASPEWRTLLQEAQRTKGFALPIWVGSWKSYRRQLLRITQVFAIFLALMWAILTVKYVAQIGDPLPMSLAQALEIVTLLMAIAYAAYPALVLGFAAYGDGRRATPQDYAAWRALCDIAPDVVLRYLRGVQQANRCVLKGDLAEVKILLEQPQHDMQRAHA